MIDHYEEPVVENFQGCKSSILAGIGVDQDVSRSDESEFNKQWLFKMITRIYVSVIIILRVQNLAIIPSLAKNAKISAR